MNYTIRKLIESDYNQYLSLINDFRPTFFSEEKYLSTLKEINKSSTILVLVKNDMILATVTIIYENKFIYNITKLAHIEDVCVKKEYRGLGYGKLIVYSAIEHAIQNGAYKVTLVCSEENINFYKKCGFEERGRQMSFLLKDPSA
jgi:glucosamine-phosphate N-acetyltransferase